jgi:tetratricopeptide (TPR) repeat protein
MLNRRLLPFALFIVLFSSSVFSQSDTTVTLVNKAAAKLLIDEAQGLLDEGQVRAAYAKFNQAQTKNPNSIAACIGAGESQYKMLNFGYALEEAKKALKINPENADACMLYAMSSHRLSDLLEALKYYTKAQSLYNSTDNKTLDIPFLKSCVEFALSFQSKPVKIERKPIQGVNSEFMDYSPVLFDGGKRMYFVSRRNGTTGGGRNPADLLYYEDIYEAVWNPRKQIWDSVSNKIGRLNSKGFDAVSFVSTDGERVYLTINNAMVPRTKRKDRTGSSDIAIAKLSKSGTWSKPKLLSNAINSDFFEGSPSLPADEKSIYFVAQRRTSEGEGTEILVSVLNGNDWSKATSVSKVINNKGRQTTPFITPDENYLFFSSDSHIGMGGYDIFVSKRSGTSWSYPVNLGPGINSVNDDTHFKYYPELKKAVLASIEIDGNRATYNMYEVDLSNFDLESLSYDWP